MKKHNNNLILLTSLTSAVTELIKNGYTEEIEDINREIQNEHLISWLQDKYGEVMNLNLFQYEDSDISRINKLIWEASNKPAGKYILIHEGLPMIKILCLQALAEYV